MQKEKKKENIFLLFRLDSIMQTKDEGHINSISIFVGSVRNRWCVVHAK